MLTAVAVFSVILVVLSNVVESSWVELDPALLVFRHFLLRRRPLVRLLRIRWTIVFGGPCWWDAVAVVDSRSVVDWTGRQLRENSHVGHPISSYVRGLHLPEIRIFDWVYQDTMVEQQ